MSDLTDLDTDATSFLFIQRQNLDCEDSFELIQNRKQLGLKTATVEKANHYGIILPDRSD